MRVFILIRDVVDGCRSRSEVDACIGVARKMIGTTASNGVSKTAKEQGNAKIDWIIKSDKITNRAKLAMAERLIESCG